MKVLVIGGTRYFGKRFVHKLIDRGDEVWILSRGTVLDDFGQNVKRLKGDRNNEGQVKELIKNLSFDVVVDQVCMNALQAEAAVRLFSKKTEYFLMTSTMSVYDCRAELKEENFNPLNYTPITANSLKEEYAEGKRGAEKVFASQDFFKCGYARFPLVVGRDDYTLRLADHINRIKEERPLYFPDLGARLSFINSEDAALALLWMLDETKTGAYNFAAATPLRLSDLIQKIEVLTGKKACLLREENTEAWSSYGIPRDWYLNVDKARNEGFEAKDLDIWLDALLDGMAGENN